MLGKCFVGTRGGDLEEHGNVSTARYPLVGTQHWNEDGRPDIELRVPGLGGTYLHILCWYCFHSDDQYNSWKAFRSDCRKKKLDVDHGEQGCWRIDQHGVWKSFLNVHKLALTKQGANRGQGEPLRQKYSLAQEKYNKRRRVS